MNTILHIVYYKMLIFLKSNTNYNLLSVIKNLGSTLVYAVFAYGCFVMTQNTINYLIETVRIGNFLLHRFVLVVLFIFFIAINIGNMIVSFSTLYKSKEVFYLITKPISFTKIFLIKFLDNFFYSSATLLLIVSAVMIGYGYFFKLNYWLYPFILLVLILPFMLIAGSAGVIVLLLVLRLSAKWGFKKVISFIGLIYISGIITFYFVSNPIKLVERVFDYYPHINQYFGFLESGLVKFLPNYWIAESLYWISENRFDRAIPYIYVNFLVCITVFLLTLFIAKKWFYTTWLASLKINSELKTVFRTKKLFFGFEHKSRLNVFDESILKREFWLFFREPNQWLHLLVMLFLITVFVSSISGIDIIILKAYNQYLKTLIYLIVTLFISFLIASLALRFVFPLISLEGEALWKIRSAPINFNKLLGKRLLIYFLIISFIGQVISFFSNYQFPLFLSVIAQFNTLLATITLVSMNFGMGGLFANYKEKNAIRLASSQGASITFLFTLLYLVLIMVILFIPVSNYFFSIERNLSFSGNALIISSTLLVIIAATSSYFFLRIGFKSFKQDI